ncbi:MAG: hypothetical protein JNL98_44540, partial [Bryobacterales bacterium]|nr:hypothetical protein [Bryobacterales bacterium]
MLQELGGQAALAQACVGQHQQRLGLRRRRGGGPGGEQPRQFGRAAGEGAGHAVDAAPALGLAGYALALIASRLLGLALNLHLWRQRLAIAPRLADSWRLPRAEVAAMLHIGLPGAAENMAWRLAYMVSVAVAASLGTQALATHTYVQQLVHLVLLCGLAIGLSVEIVVGHLIGA